MKPAASVWKALHYASGEPVEVAVRGGTIADIRPAEHREAVADNGGLIIAPGLIDIQMNGFRGIDINRMNVTAGQIRELARVMAEGGVTRFCPTVTTGTAERMKISIRAIAEACERDPVTRHAVAGIHVEGPFLCPEDGPRGAHDPENVRLPDIAEYEEWQRLSGGRVIKVTLAPELPGALEFIRRLKADGVIAAIGHTAATDDVIRAAVDAGASLSTHLGNGAHPVLPRHPNYIWSQLAEDRLWAGLIPDGFHLPPAVLKSMIRVKGDKAILTSDAVAFGGMPPGMFETERGRRIVLEPNGFLHMEETPDILAGSSIPLHIGVSRVVAYGIAGWAEAIRMASLHPARMLGLESQGAGALRAGGAADFILYSVDGDGQMTIHETVADGTTVYRRPSPDGRGS